MALEAASTPEHLRYGGMTTPPLVRQLFAASRRQGCGRRNGGSGEQAHSGRAGEPLADCLGDTVVSPPRPRSERAPTKDVAQALALCGYLRPF